MSTAISKTSSSYTADDIHVLEGLEPVRQRPGMFIGDTDKRGLHHLIWEIVDNSIDEYLNGHADTVSVILGKKGDVTITDNGRGIPVGMHKKFKKPTLELILTTLHAGGKFSEGTGYVYSGGLHGVGSSVVTALSKKLTATIRRDGHEWQQSFGRGKVTTQLEQLGPSRQHGTAIAFEPDPDIFRNTEFDAELIRERLEAMSYIHSGLKLVFEDRKAGTEPITYHNANGIPAYLEKLVRESEKERPAVSQPFAQKRDNGEKMEVALQWTEGTSEDIRSYVNGIRTTGGGTHESGLKAGIAKAVKNYMSDHKKEIKGLDVINDDIREGVVAVLSVFVREPMFQGQTKDKLNNPELNSAVDNFMRTALEAWLRSNQTEADKILKRIEMAARARLASREAVNEVKRKTIGATRLNLPGKLADCQQTGTEDSELFIVEGDSAGGSAKQGRDNKTQAILPLRGKILNSEGLPLGKVLLNQELTHLVTAIGTGAGDKFDIGKLRYGKVILLMDADADGAHISTLLLAFFFRHMPRLIEAGRVFIAQPPLYKIVSGKETFWAKDDAQKEQIIAKLRKGAKFEVSRFKGLGEMDAKVLGMTTMDLRNRTLLKVEIDSLEDTDKAFIDLLGKDASQRQRFVLDRSTEVPLDKMDV